jgi:ComF family protein
VRRAALRDKRFGVQQASLARVALGWVLDFALPPRCAGCGTIIDQVHSFCPECWGSLEFLGNGGCVTCGVPLQGTEAELCAVCLARPPRIARTRAAVGYDELSRSLVLRLKYGRKVALARTMARYIAPLIAGAPPDAVLVPVPLHRSRLWQRGFNQSLLIARELSRSTGLPVDPALARRVKRTPPLKGMSILQRRRAVSGAFKVRADAELKGRTVILVDDVLTTGSTANSCARAFRRAGARRVELVAWARVIGPHHGFER